jgi:hypothetical protein
VFVYVYLCARDRETGKDTDELGDINNDAVDLNTVVAVDK